MMACPTGRVQGTWWLAEKAEAEARVRDWGSLEFSVRGDVTSLQPSIQGSRELGGG